MVSTVLPLIVFLDFTEGHDLSFLHAFLTLTVQFSCSLGRTFPRVTVLNLVKLVVLCIIINS